MPNWRAFILYVGIVALLLATQWNWFNMPFERDEGEYAYAAWCMKDGGVPYRDCFMQKPPMIIYTYWLAQRFSDTAYWPPRMIAFLFVVLTIVVTAWAARHEYGKRCGFVTAWLLVPMMAFYSISPVAANTEKFMNLPMILVVALHLFGRHNPCPWVWLAAGASAAIASLYKPICMPVIGVVFVVWAAETIRQTDGWRRFFLLAGYASLGACAVAVLAILYFIRQGAVGAMWESTIVYNSAYAALSGWSPAAFLLQLRAFATWWWPLFLAALWFAGTRPRRGWYWWLLLLTSGLVAYKDPNHHYYMILVPFLALIAARGLEGLADRLHRWRPISWHPVLTGIWVLLLLVPVVPLMRLSPEDLANRMYGDNPFTESSVAARALAEVTEPGDMVFVAGSEPQILFYAKRKSMTRFVIVYPLMLDTRYAHSYQSEVIQSLQANPPKAIVLSTHPCSWLMHPNTGPRFVSFLNSFLVQYQAVGHYVWTSPTQGSWQRPYTSTSRGFETLVLFRRKE